MLSYGKAKVWLYNILSSLGAGKSPFLLVLVKIFSLAWAKSGKKEKFDYLSSIHCEVLFL
jgi:hypothetical protein